MKHPESIINRHCVAEISADQIRKYMKYTTPQLRMKVRKKFNAYIRNRDSGNACISCGRNTANQAGHYYSAGHYPELEFNPDNVHLQCTKCNMYLSGNLIEYRKGLERKIGIETIRKLDQIADQSKRIPYKHDRLKLIQLLITL